MSQKNVDAARSTIDAWNRGDADAFVESTRLRRDRRPVYVRGRVTGHQVLLVGGDRADPYPLGLAEHWADLRSVGRWVTRASAWKRNGLAAQMANSTSWWWTLSIATPSRRTC